MTERDGCGPVPGLPRWARRRGALIGAMAVWLPLLLAEPLAHTTDLHPAWPSWVGLSVVAVAFLGCAVVASAASDGCLSGVPAWVGSSGPALLAVLTVATVALVARSPASAMLFPLLVIAAVVMLDARAGLYAIGVVTGMSALTVWAAGATPDGLAAAAVVTALSGLGCWSFRRLFAVIAELAATREELARLAVERERERFSRDLHDLLGHTLSVIVVKAQAIQRLAPRDAEAAAQHGADVETIGRRALTEVRQAVGGLRGTGLAAEVDRAGQALAATGIAATVTAPPSAGPLPADVDALFGWVVREGVTNVIRHSGARRCVVTLSRDGGTARLDIADDGEGGPPGTGGRGLAGLRQRVAAAGGRLVAGPAGKGFCLSVDVPLPQDVSSLEPVPDAPAVVGR